MCYDSLLLIAMWMVTAGIVTALNRGEVVGGAWFQSLLFLEAYLFFAWFWIRSGATLGMKAWRLELRSNQGHYLSPRQTLVRFIVNIFGIALLGIGYWWILIDPAQRSLGDIASDSEVVYYPPERGKS